MLIHHSENPQRNLVSGTDFHVVNGEETVFDVFYLAEFLCLSADLEQITVINEEVAFRRIFQIVTAAGLGLKKRLPHRPDVGFLPQGIHQVRVVEENLLRSAQVFQIFCPVGKHGEQTGAFKGIKHLQA